MKGIEMWRKSSESAVKWSEVKWGEVRWNGAVGIWDVVKPNERATLFYTTVGPDRSRNVGNMCTNSFTPLTTRSPVPTPPTAVSLSCHSGPRLQAVRSSTPTQQNDSRSSSSSCTATQLQCGSTLSLSLSLSQTRYNIPITNGTSMENNVVNYSHFQRVSAELAVQSVQVKTYLKNFR